MQIYSWWSDMLKNYGSGRLIAVAQSADDARQIIRDGFEPWARSEREWWWIDQDDLAEELAKGRALLEKDLADEPTVSNCLFIAGSE